MVVRPYIKEGPRGLPFATSVVSICREGRASPASTWGDTR